jgi:alkylation response protein AidB-like acyl-CoA dehydrogenase
MPRSPEVVASATGPAAETVLTDEMLARFAKRAPQYDRDNAFFVDDFDELRQAGYLRVAVPAELGGAGLSPGELDAHPRNRREDAARDQPGRNAALGMTVRRTSSG